MEVCVTVTSGRYHIVAGDVKKVLEVLVSAAKQGPHRAGAFVDVPCLPLAGVVAQEGAVKTRVCVLHQLDLDTKGETDHGWQLSIFHNKKMYAVFRRQTESRVL